MPKAVNLASSIEKQLPEQLVEFMEATALVASGLGWQLYMVGGTVRDLLLGRPNYDLDMVVEGDALALGKHLAETMKTAITASRAPAGSTQPQTAVGRTGKARANVRPAADFSASCTT